MFLNELKKKFYDYNVPERWYCINDGLKPGALHVYKNYSVWEYFYLDDRGERTGFKTFNNEEAAYDYLWCQIEEQLRVFKTPQHR